MPNAENHRIRPCSFDLVAWLIYGLPQPNSNGLQPKSNGLQPRSDGLQPHSDGLQPRSDGLPKSANDIQMTINKSFSTSEPNPPLPPAGGPSLSMENLWTLEFDQFLLNFTSFNYNSGWTRSSICFCQNEWFQTSILVKNNKGPSTGGSDDRNSSRILQRPPHSSAKCPSSAESEVHRHAKTAPLLWPNRSEPVCTRYNPVVLGFHVNLQGSNLVDSQQRGVHQRRKTSPKKSQKSLNRGSQETSC